MRYLRLGSLVVLLAFQSAAGELADQLVGPDRAAREAADRALEARGASALPELQEALAKPQEGARKPDVGGKLLAVKLLSRIEGGQAADTLAQALAQEPVVAFAAARALAEQGDARGESRLRDAMASSQPLERAAAAEALASLRSVAAVPDLIRALEDESEQVRSAVIEALRDVTLQDFDYSPGDPRHDLPKDPAERQEWEAIQQWRSEQFALLKEGKYVTLEGKELRISPRDRVDYESRIKKEAVSRWNVLRRRDEARLLEAREASVAQWRAWWEGHHDETPDQWLKAGLEHPQPALRRRAASRILSGEMRELIPSLVEALGRESDVGAARVQAQALASFRDQSAIEPLIAYLERMEDRKDVVAIIDLVLIDLTGIEGISPSGRGWRSWWKRVADFYEPGRVKMWGGLEYALRLAEASDGRCVVEVRRWMPERARGKEADEDRGSWLVKPFQVKPGDTVGQKQVETQDRFRMKVQVDLTPGMVVDGIERGSRVIRRRPLQRQALFLVTLKPAGGDQAGLKPITLEIPAS